MPVSSIIPVVEDYREVILPAGYADQIRHSILIGDYLYYFCGFPLGQMLKINKNDFTDRTVLTFPNDGKHRVPLEMCHVGGILYCLFRNVDTNDVPDFQLTIGRVQVSPFAILSDFVDVAATYIVQNGSITTDDTFLYVIAGTATLYATRKILKYALSGGAPTVADVTGFGSCHCVRYAGGKLYLTGWDFPANAHVARMTTGLVIEQSVDFEAADGEFSESQFAMSDAHIWIADRSLRGIVKKFTKSDLATVTDLPTGQLSRYTSSANDGQHIWVLFENGRSVRINPSTNAQAVYTLNDGQGFQSELLGDGTYIWTGWNQDATKIARYHIPPDPNVLGAFDWLTTFGGTAFADYANVISMTVDPSGNTIVVGEMQYTVNFGGVSRTSNGDKDGFVAKYDTNGALLWAWNYGGSAGADVAYGVACDSAGNVYVAGQFNGTVDFGNGVGGMSRTSLGFSDIFLLKLNSAGVTQDVKRFGGSSTDIGTAICVDDSDNVILTGYFGSNNVTFGGASFNTNGQQDIFIAKFDSSLNHIWSKQYGGGALDQPHAIAVGRNGHPIIVGKFRGTTNLGSGNITSLGDSDGFAAMYDKDTGLIMPGWPRIIGNSFGATTYGVAVDRTIVNGDVVIVGDFVATASDPINFGGGNRQTPQAGQAFVVKYSMANVFQWQLFFGTADFSAPHVNAVAIDGLGNVIFTGDVTATENFGYGFLSGIGGTDTFIAKYSSAGAATFWAKRARPAGDFGKGVGVDASNNVIVAGWYQNRLRWWEPATAEMPDRLSPGGDSGYIVKHGP